ncbi:hypothetical protein EV122DRAFT_277755 [Schizophyllum commune]
MATTVKIEPNLEQHLDDWMKERPQIADASMPLDFKHKVNLAIEAANLLSRETTWRCLNEPSHPLVGAPIQPLYAYTDEERTTLLHDKDLDWNTLPSFLRSEISLLVAKQKVSQPITDYQSLKLSWEAERPIASSGSAGYVVPIPPLFRGMLLVGSHIPLTWFSDAYMRLASDIPHLITKEITLLTMDDKLVTLSIIGVDCMVHHGWPNDVDTSDLTFKGWEEAFNNLLRVCATLADPADAVDGKTNVTSELTKHFGYFRAEILSVPPARTEQCFSDCYTAERELRMDVLQKRPFDFDEWERRAKVAIQAAEAARAPPPAPQPRYNDRYDDNRPGSSRSRKRRW